MLFANNLYKCDHGFFVWIVQIGVIYYVATQLMLASYYHYTSIIICIYSTKGQGGFDECKLSLTHQVGKKFEANEHANKQCYCVLNSHWKLCLCNIDYWLVDINSMYMLERLLSSQSQLPYMVMFFKIGPGAP